MFFFAIRWIVQLASVNLSDPPVLCSPVFDSELHQTVCHEEPESERFCLMEPNDNKAAWDLSVSPYAGGEDLLLAHRICEKFETFLLKNVPLIYKKTAYARFFRLSELVAVWLPINYFTMLLQHEVFGHGYRIRDLHTHQLAKVNGYYFEAPPPYGSGGAETNFSISPHFTTSEDSAVSSGGVESTAILAWLTKLKWIQANTIDPRQALLYLLCEQDLTFYISTLNIKEVRSSEGHDINCYIKSVNFTYPEQRLNRGRLRSLSWINFADPFTFYAIYSWFHYLSSGREMQVPMIGSSYLPSFRLGLTPFGPEIFFENFFAKPFYMYFKGGRHSGNTYLGTGFYAPELKTFNRWVFGLRVDLWYQPKLLLQPGTVRFSKLDFRNGGKITPPLYSSQEQHAMQWGAAGSLITAYHWTDQCSYEGEVGYKAQGFLPGYSLFAYPTIRLSCALTF